MAYERSWPKVLPIAFTANGGQFGLVTVSDTAGFRVKQSCAILSNTLPPFPVQVKAVLSSTQMIVGLVDNQIPPLKPLDISAYTTAIGSSIGAEWQPKNSITIQDIQKATYEADPVVALRTVAVDEYGNIYTKSNPMPIIFDGTVELGDVSIVDSSNHNRLAVNSDGSINVVVETEPGASTALVNTYNEVLAVASGLSTTVVTYTCPIGKTALLERAVVSGDNIARYDVQINSATQGTLRTMFGSNLDATFDFSSGSSGLLLNSGDVVNVLVLHNRPYTGNFEGRIQVLEITP